MTFFPPGKHPQSALIVALLAGCATTPADLSEAKAGWQGAGYDDVVLRWGAPSRSTKLSDGRDVHTWVSESAGTRGRTSVGIGVGGGSGGVGMGTGVMFGSPGGDSVRCERTLVFKDRRVADQTWLGPAEYCSGFRRDK